MDPLAEALESISAPPEEAPETPAPELEESEAAEAETPESEGSGDDGSAEAAEEEPEAEQEDGEQEEPAEVDPFSDEALSTPEGVKAAAEALREQQTKVHHQHLRMKKREGKFKRQLDEWRTERNRQQSLHQQVMADLQTLQTGDASSVLRTLGRLTGRDAAKVYEEISLNMMRNGAPKESSELEQVKAQLREMQEERRLEQLRGQQYHLQQQARQRMQQIAQMAQQSAETPLLARYAHENPQDVASYVSNMMQSAYQSGNPIDPAEAFRTLEAQLNNLRSRVDSAATEPASDVGRETDKPKPKKAPSPPGRGIKRQSAASVREMTDEERLEDLAKDTGFLEGLGLL